MENYLMHAGKAHDENPPGRGSGRYPWGSGNRKHQHSWDVYSRIEKLRAQGMEPKDIAKAMGWTMEQYNKETKKVETVGNTSRYKAEKEIAVHEMNMDKYEEVMWYTHALCHTPLRTFISAFPPRLFMDLTISILFSIGTTSSQSPW